LVHDALIREWPRLAGWLAADRDFLRWQRSVAERARAWSTSQDRGDLLRDGSLHEADRHLATRRATPAVEALVAASRDADRRRRQVRTGITSLLVGLVVVAVLAISLWWRQSREANEQTRVALANADRALAASLATQAQGLLATRP
jgi:hypothetical protein